MSGKSETTGWCPIIEGLMGVRLVAEDRDHPAVDAAVAEIKRLRAVIRVNALRWAPHLTHAEIDEVIHGKQS